MRQEYKYIENLLERFFEGETSNREEQELYRFFNGKEIPEHLIHYREVFEYFETGITREISEEVGSRPIKKIAVDRWLTIIACVAASLLLLIMIRPLFADDKEVFEQYAGSYIIQNGEKITDLKKIIPRLENNFADLDERLNRYEGIGEIGVELENRYNTSAGKARKKYQQEFMERNLYHESVWEKLFEELDKEEY